MKSSIWDHLINHYFLCSNTTQPVRVDRTNMSKRYLSDFKRRCYEESGGDGGPASAMMTCEEQEMNDIQS